MKFASIFILFGIVGCYLNRLDTAILAHPYLPLATFPVSFSVLGSWKNRTKMSTNWSTGILTHKNNIRTALFLVMAQQVVVISYRRFGTTCRSHLERSNIHKKAC